MPMDIKALRAFQIWNRACLSSFVRIRLSVLGVGENIAAQ